MQTVVRTTAHLGNFHRNLGVARTDQE